MHRLKISWLQILANIAALLPLAILGWDFAWGQLTADPIREITIRTGRSALILLVLSLSCAPINLVFGIRQVLPLRRTLGLYAFLYACLHFLTFIGLDYGFNFPLIREDIAGKYFVLIGFAAFLLLLLRTVTSTRGWQKRLERNWQQLRWLVYVAAVLVVTHFMLAVVLAAKEGLSRPMLYVALLALLLIIRLPGVRKAVNKLRHRLVRSKENGSAAGSL
jgi:sulfoxide reductase heme-binding subunit YedZ